MKTTIGALHPNLILLLPFGALLAFVFLFNSTTDFTGLCGTTATLNSALPVVLPVPEFRLLIGVLTLPHRYERRHLLRTVYSIQLADLLPRSSPAIDVRFFFCRIIDDADRELVKLEILRYGDVNVLDCLENMDSGKTYKYFSTIPSLFPPYDYVMKTDDDTFLRLPRLAEALHRMPRKDMYFGCLVPCDWFRPEDEYMSGMGYVVSWDIVEYISTSPEWIRNHTEGPEDRLMMHWLRDGGRGKNRFDAKPAMYNFPSDDSCAHELVPDTIAVHQLKDNGRWTATLQYFNSISFFQHQQKKQNSFA